MSMRKTRNHYFHTNMLYETGIIDLHIKSTLNLSYISCQNEICLKNFNCKTARDEDSPRCSYEHTNKIYFREPGSMDMDWINWFGGSDGKLIVTLSSYFFCTFTWPCIVTNFYIIKPTRCTNFTNLFWHGTLHASILVLLESCLHTCMTYNIAECSVNKILMMDRRTVRNM